METEFDNKFTWVIKNFSSLESNIIYSDPFVIGRCKWRLFTFPKGNRVNFLSVYMEVADFESLPFGWRRHVEFSITIVNQILESFSQVRGGDSLKPYVIEHWFDQKEPDWGFTSIIPISKLMNKKCGFLVNEEVKIVAEIDVLEVIGKLDLPDKDWININGFQVLSSQVDFARRVFETYPEIARELDTKNQDLRASYMNVLLSLIKIIFKWPQEQSDDDLSEAETALKYMKSVGFKLDWLEKKLNQVKEHKKKRARVCEMEKELNDLEKKCKDLKTQVSMEKAEILEATTPDMTFNDVVW